MNTKQLHRLLLVFCLISVLLVGFTIYYYFFVYIADIKTLDMHLTIADKAGISGDTDAIYFGVAPPGGSSEKWIVVRNQEDEAVKVAITKKGSIAPFVHFSENFFTLESNESRQITVSAEIPKNATYGNYTGKLRIIQHTIN